jgi:hypothetical protein
MEYVAEKIEHKGYTIKIIADENPESPREWDNLGKMICFHKRHRLGDKTDLKSGDFNGWSELAEHLIREHGGVLLALYLYDHSGLRISTGSFHGRAQHAAWDSGQIGFIHASRAALLAEYSVKRLTKAIVDKALKVLEGEVETYDQYLRGDVYGYVIEDADGEEIEDGSCWGFYGQEYCESEARSLVDVLAAKVEATVQGENASGDGI